MNSNSNRVPSSLFDKAYTVVLFLFYGLFGWHRWWSGVSPRLIRGSAERDAIHHEHLSNGGGLFVLVLILLLIWLFRPGSSVGAKVRRALSTASSTAITLFFIAGFLAMLYGMAQAWAVGGEISFFHLFVIPPFVDWSWSTAGYMHSVMANISSALFAGIIFVYLYTKLCRYMKPLFAVGLLLLVHVLIDLPKPPSLHPIAAIGTYVMVPTYYLIGLALYNWANTRRWVYWPVLLLFIGFFLYLPYFAFKVLPPWHVQEAVAVEQAVPTTPLSPERIKSEILPDEAALAAAKETASWCSQCHNMEPQGAHLLGPKLAGVFNQQAGTVAGYGRNSQALVKAGAEGLYWNRENLALFLTDGQKLVPGNLMNQQTDLSDPQKLQQVIDYLEYLSAPESR